MSNADHSEFRLTALPTSAWGALAFDLVMQSIPVEELLTAYNLTQAQLDALLDNTAFQMALRDAQSKLQQMGAVDMFPFRARILTEDLMEDVFRDAKQPGTDPVLRHKIFETFSRLAHLDPSTNKKAGASEGAKFVFNFAPGVRDLAHVMPVEITVPALTPADNPARPSRDE